MAISGVSSYKDAMYQWQAQQLKNTGNTSSNNSTSSTINSLLGGTTSMTSQISSMVELTKYAMDQMGVSSSSKVTFSQITRYREQLQSEFNAAVKAGLDQSGIGNLPGISFEIDKSGKIAVTGENASDRKKAQEWLDANPSYGASLLAALPQDVFENGGTISFSISTTGKITPKNTNEEALQQIFNGKNTLAETIRNGIKAAGIKISYPLELKYDPDGQLAIAGTTEEAEAMNAWLKDNTEFSEAIQKEIQKYDIDPSSVSLRINEEGPVQISLSNARIKDIQAAWDNQSDTGAKIMQGLSSLGIDKNISFAIQINDDGSISILSDHPDAAKVQKFFNENPDLVKKYRQIETLAGLDDARKSMQISPSAMRKRVQIESMASWWADSGSANSYFGNYSNNGLALLSGLNLNI